jgi:monoamine oxidase
MDTKTILEYCQLANVEQGKRITILGAGIAGLVAAYELERLGHQVEILEGSSRIGGRIFTHRFGEGENASYAELGAMRIPSEHKHVLHYIESMGLSDKLCKFMTVFEEDNALMNMQGKVFRMKDAPSIFKQQYEGIFSDTRYTEKTRLFAAWLKTIVDAIAPGKLRESLEQDLESHLMDELERLDLEPFFSEDGNTIDLHSFIKANPSFRARCHKDLDLFFGDILVETSHDLLQLKGGTDQLIDRLVKSISAPIKLNQEIVAMHVKENGTEISWRENGKIYTRLCDYVLCTIPFSILRKMELSGFDADKLDAINNTVYCPATKVAFHCAEAFWQKDGIKGGASFSGEGIRQTYYPSVKLDPAVGSTFLASYTIGDDADKLGMMSEEVRYTYVEEVLSQIHPELKTPGMLLDKATIAWGNYKWSAGGCSIPWGGEESNQLQQHFYYLEAARPQNRLFFAGEHCSKYPAWIQGSIESALEAVYEIVAYKPFTTTNTVPVAKAATKLAMQSVGV